MTPGLHRAWTRLAAEIRRGLVVGRDAIDRDEWTAVAGSRVTVRGGECEAHYGGECDSDRGVTVIDRRATWPYPAMPRAPRPGEQ